MVKRLLTGLISLSIIVGGISIAPKEAQATHDYCYQASTVQPGSTVNMRLYPNKNGKVIGSLVDGQYVKVLNYSGEWAKVITYSGKKGWVHTAYLDYACS